MTGQTVTGELHDDAGSGDACLFAATYLPPSVDARKSARDVSNRRLESRLRCHAIEPARAPGPWLRPVIGAATW
jgi:hypothetical protein